MISKKLKRVRLWQLLTIVAVIAFLLGLLLPTRRGKVDTVIKGGPLMKKIYNQVIAGETKNAILDSLSESEKNILEAYHLAWLDSVPIITEFGKLKSEYLPVNHVVVYGIPESESGSKKWAQEAYVNANGFRFYCFKDVSLEQLIRTTNFGTSEILTGPISDITEIPNSDIYVKDTLYEYLLLKKLIIESSDFLEFAFDLAFRIEPRTRVYTVKLLKDSIESPPLPEVGLHWNEEDHKNWELWYEKNATQAKITNTFLFDTVDKNGIKGK